MTQRFADSSPLASAEPAVRFSALRAPEVVPALTRLLQGARARIAEIAAQTGPSTYDSTLGALEEVELTIDRAMGIVRHLEDVATTPEWREAYNTVRPEVAAFLDGLPLDAGLWRVLQAYADSADAAALDPVRARHLKKVVDAFRREGADLTGADKARLEAINRALSDETSNFAQNVVDSTAGWSWVVEDESRLAGLPASAVAAVRAEAERRGLEGYCFTLAMPCYQAVMAHADDAGVRETLYRAYNRRATTPPHDNLPHVRRVLALRQEKAHLLGFGQYADFVLADRMAGTGARARAFVLDLQARTRAAYQAEIDALLAFRRELEGPDAPELQPWDVGWYARKLQQARYAFDDEQLRPYFPLTRVLEGAFALFEQLYGLSVRPRPDLESWDPGVRAFELRTEAGEVAGLFHVDLFPRPTKRDGAWMNPLMVSAPGTPHLGLIAGNMSPPVGDTPALLRFAEVETVFHELGHLLHHLVSRVPVRSLSGTSVAWDFVELPSQIHENFCYSPAVMPLISGHYETGECMPAEFLDALRRARTFRAATAQMRQLAFAELDLALHVDYDPERDGDVLAFSRAILQRGTPAPLPNDHALIAAFSHLFASPVAYSAGYYSYKWAEVLDADAFETLAPDEGIDPAAGRRFLETLLSRGNSAAPEELFEAFVGRPPSLDPLLRRNGLIG
jgi:oligopeptidase A